MPAVSKLSKVTKSYVGVVTASGFIALAHSAASVSDSPPARGWIVLSALTLLTGSLTLKIPTVSARLSVSEVFVFAAVLWFGPGVATFIVVLDALVGALWQRNRTGIRVLFNVCAGASAIWLAAHLYGLVAPQSASSGRPAVEDLLFPVGVLAVSYFTINSFL